MLEYAEQYFKLEKRQKDGATLRQHLKMAFQATGVMPEQLAVTVELPRDAEHVWEYFVDLHNERGHNGMTPNRINSTAIKDWCMVTRVILEPWEVSAIKQLDRLWMSYQND